ncbi:MAG TPA: Ig-like domain-containing protein, partial [Tepidisphaeraceae bacterium]|nr:Ig-like domain-containing protein [Tepidisphaeraceae bacterium]
WTLTVASHSNPAHGTLTLNSDGSFTYAANNNFTGQDSFTYTATDDINAPANTATVTINVTDLMPQANWQMLYLAQAQDSHGNNLAYAASLSGSLLGNDPDQDPLTWSLVSGPQAGQGTFSFDSNTGSFTFTPPQNSTMSTATVIVKANDGALDSNLATIIFPGYNIPTGGTINSVGLASPGLGDSFGVGENGTLQVAAPGLLNEAQDPYSSNPPTLGGMIAGPQHGTLSVNSADGSFVYQPNPGFVGEDFFTCEILGQNGSAGYKTDFVTVDPTTVGLSFDSLAPGDPSALIPSEQVQPPVNGSPAFATLYLNTVEPQVTGTSLTLSVNSDVVADIDVYDGIPGQSGTNLLFGADNGLSSATWTIGPNLVALPSQVYVVGLNPTTYDQAVFTLSLTLGVQTQWAPASPPSAPATQPVVAAQKGTVPGLKGHLVAFDGSGDSQQDNTDISQFLTADDGVQNFYEPGVGNPHDTPFGKLRYSTIAFGDAEAMVFERDALREVQTFYSDPKNIHIPLDVIGYSRGAFEAVKLINNVFNDGTGIGDLRYKRTTRTLGIPTGTTYDGHYLHPQVRFVGLISPVMGPMRVPFLWSESLPPGVTSMYQALDNFPNDDFLPQVTMTRSAGTGGDPDIQYPLAHTVIGKDPKVEADMVAAAKGVGVQLK